MDNLIRHQPLSDRVLSPQQIQEINRYLDVSTGAPDHADLIFVFGTRFPTPAHIAADLFQRQIAPYIVLTGGVNRETGEHEALAHRDILIARGIHENRIIAETQSVNTLENVLFALPLIQQTMKQSPLQRVLAVVKWQHSRRALMTLKRHFPPGIRYYAITYAAGGVVKDDWHLSQEGRERVLKNWHGIPKYLERDHIAPITLDGDAYI